MNAPAAVVGDRLLGVRRLVIDELANEQLWKVWMLAEEPGLCANERANAIGVAGGSLDRVGTAREQLTENALEHGAVERLLAVVVVVEQAPGFTSASLPICLMVVAAKPWRANSRSAASRMRSWVEDESATPN